MFRYLKVYFFILFTIKSLFSNVVEIPSYCAYFDDNSTTISKNGLQITQDTNNSDICWYVYFNKTGSLNIKLKLFNDSNSSGILRLSIDNRNFIIHDNLYTGTDDFYILNVGKILVDTTGYKCIKINGIRKSSKKYGIIKSIILSGQSSENCKYLLPDGRNCTSVHLNYLTEKELNVEYFYNEVMVPRAYDHCHTFYNVCGFQRGYFGIQHLKNNKRVIIFSVWDSGDKKKSRKTVAEDNQVKLIKKGCDVIYRDFGHEGTGGHTHLEYNWTPGEKYKFLLKAEPKENNTIYSAYFFLNDSLNWKLIAKFEAQKDGQYLNHLHSFIENFWETNGNKKRFAYFSNQWLQSNGKWIELINTRFTHTHRNNINRKDYDFGTKAKSFYLTTGGFKNYNPTYCRELNRIKTNNKPVSLQYFNFNNYENTYNN